ncbi:MAG: hypothetical protein HY360_21330 [Verrucomicrobia bacterium]|nr:hypothetical protein [Verrucomicrobiota bacterium]
MARFSDDNSPAITQKKHGKGRAILFAYNPFEKERNIYPGAPWVKFFTALQKDIGIKMNREIWKFKFPAPNPTPVPQGFCLTGNNVAFDANCPLNKHNLKSDGTYSYAHPPSGTPDVSASGEMPFGKGHLTDRPSAANNRILGRWISESKSEVPRWTVSWTDNKETAITFDLKKSFKVNSLRLFYSDQLPDVVIEGSVDIQKWDKLGSSEKQDATQDVLDKGYPLKGTYRYLRVNLKERDPGKPMTLVEAEVWGNE